MNRFRNFLAHHKRTLCALLGISLFSVTVTFAVPPSSPYAPGATLDPQCAPGSANCSVSSFAFGAPGGQTIAGGTNASDTLTLTSTSNATKGKILFGTSAYDEANNRLGIGTTSPDGKLVIVGNSTVSAQEYPFESYTSFGDSITAGAYATIEANRYVNLLAAEISLSVTNNGVGGARAAGHQPVVYDTSVSATGSQLFTYMIGTNDIFSYGSSVDAQANFKSIVAAEMAWLAIPEIFKTRAQSPDVSYVGSWSNSSYYGGNLGRYSSTSGDTATFTVSGTTAYVAYTMLDGNAGQFSVTVDGVDKGTYQNYGQNGSLIDTTNGTVQGSGLLRLSSLGSGSHTVVLTVTSATDPNNKVFFDWAAGNGNISGEGLPTLIQGGVPKRNSPLVYTYSELVAQNVNSLSSDGLRVYYADTTNAMDIATDLDGDGVHPNDLGMSHIYDAFLIALPTTVTGSENTLAVTSSSGQNQFVVSSGGYLGVGITNPEFPLSVQGESQFRGIASFTQMNPLSALSIDASSSSLHKIYNNGTADLSLSTSIATPQFYLKKNGNIGIGTNNPTASLEIWGTSQTTAALTDTGVRTGILALNSSGASTGHGGTITFGNGQSTAAGSIGFAAIKGLVNNGLGNTTGHLAFATRTSVNATGLLERMRITASGYVGIGTTLPQTVLDVGGASTAGEVSVATLTNPSTSSLNGVALVFDNHPTLNYSSKIVSQRNSDAFGTSLGFFTQDAISTASLTEKMRITNAGFLGISNTSPSYILHVGSGSVTTGTTVARFQNAGGTCDVVPSTASGITCTSDERLKKNITTINNSILDKVLELRPVTYNMNVETEGTALHAGFLAQELESVFPDLVRTDAEGWKSVNYAGMIPYTVQAIKEMNVTMQALPTFEDPTLAEKVSTFLKGIAERGEAVINSVTAKKVNTQELCIGEESDSICVNKEQLRNLLQGSGTTTVVSPPPSDPVEEETPPTEEETPEVVEEETVPEPTPPAPVEEIPAE